MVRVPTEVTAAQRARWLAELSHALEEAQRLIWRLSEEGVSAADTLDLAARLETARAEVRSLRLGRTTQESSELNPKWIDQALWDRAGSRAD